MTTMLRQANAFFKVDEQGAVAPMFALFLMPAVMGIGISVDYARSTAVQQRLQHAADRAVIAAAKLTDASDDVRAAAAQKMFNETARQDATIAKAGLSKPTVTVRNGVVSIVAKANVPTSFSRIGGINSIGIGASTSANVPTPETPGAPACVLALEPSERGIWLNGGRDGSHIDANCAVQANSTSTSAIFGNRYGTLKASSICVGGDYDTSISYSVTPRTRCSAIADPFASLAKPDVGACTYRNFKAKNGDVLSPGVYCGGLDIERNAKVTFRSGTYVIKDGAFSITSNASAESLTGGVFFFLTGTNARLKFAADADVKFKALTSGTYKGVLLFADRDTALSQDHLIGAKSSTVLEGAIYSPSTGVQISSSGTVLSSADWTVWVVKALQLTGSAKLTVRAATTGSETPVPTLLSGTPSTGIRLLN